MHFGKSQKISQNVIDILAEMQTWEFENNQQQ
jgi:hypothetical protein